MESNLLVTYEPSHRAKALQEVKLLLEEAGEQADFADSDMEGVFFVRVGDPKGAVRRLFALCSEDSGKFVYTQRWIPVEKWLSSDMGEMAGALAEYNERIGADEKWKIDVVKRSYNSHSTPELIKGLTESIDKEHVDLKHPDKIVKVEIFGNKAGIALLESDELLEVPKMRK